MGKAREKKENGMKLEAAVHQAVEECISEGILTEFFRKHKEEIVEMSIFEFDQELHDKTLFEDGVAVGEEKGEKKGDIKRLVSLICKKMKKNKTLEEIAEDLEEESSVIEPLYREAEKFAPDYDPAMVFEKINVKSKETQDL